MKTTDESRSNGRATDGLRDALATTAAASARSYGYTVSIWSSGALLMHEHGLPQTADVFAFLTGALIAFGLIAFSARHGAQSGEQPGRPSDQLLVGALHWFAAGGAVGVVAFASPLHGWAAWGVSSFAVTCVYILGASLQLAMVEWFRDGTGGVARR